MKVRESVESVDPSSIAGRVREFSAQSHLWQPRLSQVTDELTRVHARGSDFPAPKHTDAPDEVPFVRELTFEGCR